MPVNAQPLQQTCMCERTLWNITAPALFGNFLGERASRNLQPTLCKRFHGFQLCSYTGASGNMSPKTYPNESTAHTKPTCPPKRKPELFKTDCGFYVLPHDSVTTARCMFLLSCVSRMLLGEGDTPIIVPFYKDCWYKGEHPKHIVSQRIQVGQE